ncbi:MAG: integrase arm-type DNA-binding domain-containing protein [Desulfuromonadales bacterium]
MPKRIPPISELKVQKARPKDKSYRLNDGEGLYLLVTPSGGKLWRFDYTFAKTTRKTLAFGPYPEISLVEARKYREDARTLVAHGIDPSTVKKNLDTVKTTENSFEAVAREWHEKFKSTWCDKHGFHKLQRMESNIFPWIGSTDISAITAPDLLAALRRVESRGAGDLSHRIRTTCVQVFQYGIATGRCQRNVAMDLKGALAPVRGKHLGAPTTPAALSVVLKGIDAFNGSRITTCALMLTPMLMVRPGELRHMEWSELDFIKNEWNIPAGKMKMKVAHLVPLARQAVAVLNEVRHVTGHGKYVFPSQRTSKRPMSDNTINAALRRLGFGKDEVTGHGFRATARTILDEVLQVRPDYIEHQLAHAVRDPNGRAYNRTAHLDERRKMMQLWADYLDELKR